MNSELLERQVTWEFGLDMRVLIADKFERSGRDGLLAIGCDVSFQPDLKDDALTEAIREQTPDILVVRGTKVTESMLALQVLLIPLQPQSRVITEVVIVWS